jgi:hypothetical protein
MLCGCVEQGTEENLIKRVACRFALESRHSCGNNRGEKIDLPILTAVIARPRLCWVGTVLLGMADTESAKKSKIMNST